MPFEINIILVMLCGVLSVTLCLRAEKMATLFGIMDVPDIRKKHEAATPLMGGLVLLFAFAPCALAWIALDASPRWIPTMTIWLASVITVAAVGVADDRHSLSPTARLVLTFMVFGTAAVIDPTFNVRLLDFLYFDFSIGLGTWWLAIIFTMICLVGLLNAVNMADGKNGLVLGLCIGWLFILALRAPAAIMPLLLILLTACVVLFVFNMGGKLFLGDGGAYGLASAVGMVAIVIYNTPGAEWLRAVSAEELVLLFAVPVFDSFRLTYVRWRQGRSPMSPDRDHLHHHLQDKFGWPLGLIIYLLIAIFPAAAIMFLG